MGTDRWIDAGRARRFFESGKTMKVLIMEPHASGHHGPYLAWMASGLVERGFDVTVITLPETAKHPLLQELHRLESNKSGASIQLIISEPLVRLKLPPESGKTSSLLMSNIAYWRLFKAWYRALEVNLRPDVVFLPYVDYCLNVIGLFGSPFESCPWVGLTMRPSFHYRRVNVIAPLPTLAGIKKKLFFRVLRNRYLKKLLTVDEPLVNYLKIKHCMAKAAFFPEPAEHWKLKTASEAKRQIGIAADRKILLLYGSISARKGVVEALKILASSDFPVIVDVLLAGKIAESAIKKVLGEHWVRDLLDRKRLKIIDHFIESEEETTLFAAADIIWLGYRGHYNSSGLLAQAASAGRPVLACADGVIGWQTRRHNLGIVVDPGNTKEVIAAIKTLLEDTSEKDNNKCTATWRPPSFIEAQNMLSHVLSTE